MTEHKFTDEEIIRALECCRTIDGNDCSNCPYYGKRYEIGSGGCSNHLVNDALDLINRQKAEIAILNFQVATSQSAKHALQLEFDKYKGVNKILDDNMAKLITAAIEGARAEAIKEFAERLKTYYRNLDKTAGALIEYHIDEIVKEMLEGDVCGANTETER